MIEAYKELNTDWKRVERVSKGTVAHTCCVCKTKLLRRKVRFWVHTDTYRPFTRRTKIRLADLSTAYSVSSGSYLKEKILCNPCVKDFNDWRINKSYEEWRDRIYREEAYTRWMKENADPGEEEYNMFEQDWKWNRKVEDERRRSYY